MRNRFAAGFSILQDFIIFQHIHDNFIAKSDLGVFNEGNFLPNDGTNLFNSNHCCNG